MPEQVNCGARGFMTGYLALSAYCMGSLNKDCWYMYTLKDFSRKMTSEPDQTIEILMSELDPEIMQIFHRENSSTAQEAREVGLINGSHFV